MAGLEPLVSIIYHEKQQPGSMLCAQHALNSLLQGNYFTAPDLSDLGRTLDALEDGVDDAHNGGASTNMDDTGFFSVQVLEKALHVWGLNLIRWRSEAMRPYQPHPHTQLGFVLNFQQHWFTLRRFGPASPDINTDPGEGHWFNLNSFLQSPEWVSKLYLGMVLQQAEEEGYSVFAVTQAEPSAPLALARVPADDVASTLPEPTSASRHPPHLSTSRDSSNLPSASSVHRPIEGFEDEDMELQAALQASLMADSSSSSHDFIMPLPEPSIPPPLARPAFAALPASVPGSGSHTPTQPSASTAEASNDPVAASMVRNRAMLERMQREQEMALREGYEEEAARIETQGRLRGARSTASEDEDEQLRRAILESQVLAEPEGHERNDIDDDVEMDGEYHPPPPRIPAPSSLFEADHRVYDDDDAELQAALKASLEHMPEDFVIPENTRPSASTVAPEEPPISSSKIRKREEYEESEVDSEADSSVAETLDPPPESVDVDEMRKRRLARFGV